MQARDVMALVKTAMRPREVLIELPTSEFPEQIVTVPDSWPSIKLAPLYDVHKGHAAHDAAKFARHVEWIADTKNVLTWNGGDLIENSSKFSVGGGVYEQDLTPHQQVVQSILDMAPIAHKMLFMLPGNHEARTNQMGVSLGYFIAMATDTPYWPDYAFVTIKWRGNNFRLLAHHGSGGAQTAGAQRNAARKALPWANFDMYWTGHLHNPLADPVMRLDYDQKTGRMVERSALVVISPSYLKFFGTYAAASQYAPGTRGLGVVELQEDGRIDVSMYANGKRL